MDMPKVYRRPPVTYKVMEELQTCSTVYRRHEPTRDPSNQSAVAAATSR
jgi:hypothetical protein